MQLTPTQTLERRPAKTLVLLMLAVLAVAAVLQAAAAQAQVAAVYMSPYCGCCGKWVDHLRQNGFSVDKRMVEDLAPVRSRYGVPAELASCHTAVVDGYVVEGHVPASDIRRLLDERPSARGLAAPGMPAGAPGMESAGYEPYVVLLFDERGTTTVFARH